MKRVMFQTWLVFVVCLIVLLVGLAGCGPSRTVVAEVNGERITSKDIQDELARLPVSIRPLYEQNPVEILNRLIAMSLLLQEAKRKGLVASTSLRGLDKPAVQEGIGRLIEMQIKDAGKVTDKEVEAFYQRYRDQMEGRPLSEVEGAIHKMILEQKQQQRINDLVNKLRVAAAITTYPERLPKPPSLPLEPSTAGDFDKALKNGRPTVVDFSSSRCIVCIRLSPVMRELKDAHADRINVIGMEVNDHRELALRYKVRLVPTVVFFDALGREKRRVTGFMDRPALEKTLRELGFLGG